MTDDDLSLDPNFADRFKREKRPPCQLYLISPPAIGPDFPELLKAALDAGPVAAFQLRLKGASDDDVFAAAAAWMPVCADRDVAFISNATSEERRVGKECVGKYSSRWSPIHLTKKNRKN